MAVTFHGVTDRSAQNNAGQRTYSVSFRLSTNDKADGPFAVGSHPDLPVIGSPWPEDSSAFCNSLSVQNSDPWRGWTVTATYSDERAFGSLSGSNPGSGSANNPYKAEGGSTNPKDDEVKFSWSGHTYEEVVRYDAVSGKSILNSAGDPFSEPATREVTDAVCTVNYRALSVPSEVLALQNTVNEAAITVDGRSFPKRSVRMQNLTVGQREYRNGVAFRNVSYQLMFRSGRTTTNVSGLTYFNESAGWDWIALSTGYQELDRSGPTTKKRDCLKEDGTRVTEPALLDVDGEQITGDDLNQIQLQSYYLNYRLYEGGDFTLLRGVS